MSIIFAAYDLLSLPLAGLTPSWHVVVDAGTGAPISPQPTFTDIGDGLYQIGSALTSSGSGIIDLGATALPRFIHVDGSSHSTAAAYDSATELPIAGLTPIWDSIVDGGGLPVAGPAFTDLGLGLYRIDYSGPDSRAGVIDFGVGRSPRFSQWAYDPFNADPPVIANMVPAPGSIGQMVLIDFDVTDVDPGILRIILHLKYAADAETLVVHDGSSFNPPFDGPLNVRTSISDGFHYTLMPAGGWTGGFTLEVVAIDSAGNQAT